MYLLPAIDILDGRAVRLAKGDYNAVTVYNDDPVAQAREFEARGATWLHVVDLNGARSGIPENLAIIEQIVRATKLKVEVGGGIRSLETVARLADVGVSRMVLGTSLVKNRAFAHDAIAEFGDLLACGIDAKAGEVAIAGWEEGSGTNAYDLAREMSELGYAHIIFTDIARDGMQTGIDPAAYERMARAFGHPVIVSGGVASVADIEALTPIANLVEGVIAGRAIYEGALSVEAGVAACEQATRACIHVVSSEGDAC